MAILHFFQLLRSWLLGAQPGITAPSFRSEVLRSWRRLDDNRLHDYHAVYGMGTRIHVLYPNVEAYTASLRELSARVRAGRTVSALEMTGKGSELTLDRFMLDGLGRYVEVVPTLIKLRRAAVDLLEALESSDYTDHGVPEHNLRVLGKVLQNLQDLSNALWEVIDR